MPSPPPPITVVRPPANAGSVKIVSKMLAPNASKVVNAATGGVISNPGGGPKKMLIPVSQPLTAENLEALRSQGLVKSGGMTADGKRIIIVKKSAGQLGGQLPGNLGGQLRIISKASINSGIFYFIFTCILSNILTCNSVKNQPNSKISTILKYLLSFKISIL